MVGRARAAARRRSPAPAGRGGARGARTSSVEDGRGVARVNGVSFAVAAARSSASPASRATASRSWSRRSPALPRRARGDRATTGASLVRGGPARGACAGSASATCPRTASGSRLSCRLHRVEDSAILGSQASRRSTALAARRDRGARRMPAARPPSTTSGRRTGARRTSALSGGNQQKIVVARELDRRPRLLLVAQPTRGVDVGAVELIHRRLRRAARAGAAVLLVSAELDEILALVRPDPGDARGPHRRRARGRVGHQPCRGPLDDGRIAGAGMSRERIAGLLLPPLNLAVALALSGVVVALAGADPARALTALVAGAFGSGEAVGHTLFYATSFAFTGLAVAVAFHAGLFNIGAEGHQHSVGAQTGARDRLQRVRVAGRRTVEFRPVLAPLKAAWAAHLRLTIKDPALRARSDPGLPDRLQAHPVRQHLLSRRRRAERERSRRATSRRSARITW